jgi:hypothetical protein
MAAPLFLVKVFILTRMDQSVLFCFEKKLSCNARKCKVQNESLKSG